MEHVGTTSSDYLIQRIGNTFNINNSNWQADALDWIGQAIGLIGYHVGFQEKDIILKVSSHRCVIPKIVNSIEYIEYCGIRLPIGIDKSDYAYFKPTGRERDNILNSQETLQLSKEIDRLNALREIAVTQDPITEDIAVGLEDATRKINMYVGTGRLAANAINNFCGDYYNLDGPYIKTSFESGTIVVKSNCFKTDDKGSPLVVNTEKYLQAVSWYVMSRILLRGYNHPVITYKQANDEWEEVWKPRAQNEPKMPSIDKLERFTQRWTSLVRGRQANYQV